MFNRKFGAGCGRMKIKLKYVLFVYSLTVRTTMMSHIKRSRKHTKPRRRATRAARGGKYTESTLRRSVKPFDKHKRHGPRISYFMP
jgi:hypothetical protein